MMLSIDCKKIFCDLITFFLNSVWNECVNGLKIVIVARDYKTDTRTKTETEMILEWKLTISAFWNWNTAA